MLRAFLGIKDEIEAILATNGITSKQRVIFEEFRAIAGKNKWVHQVLLELATFVTLRPIDYHLFIRQRKKMNPPEIRARILTSQNGQLAPSLGRGRATFIENTATTRLAIPIATVQIVNFLMSWFRLWLMMDARASIRLPRTWA